MIPISTIANAIQGTVPGKDCMTWREILQMLCEATAIPESICKILIPDEDDGDDDDDPSQVGPLKDVKASGRCKCVGDDSCGGGKIYEFTFSTKKGCKEAQKDADDCCNNNETMKQRCVRPKCYYRHTDPTCPDESNDAPPCPGRLINSAGPSGGPPFIPAPAPGVTPPVPPPPGPGMAGYRCDAKCQEQCPDGVKGYLKGTSSENCSEATQDAKSKASRGCYPRHCSCKDTDGFRGTGTQCENHTR